jgi:hypothetical protein
LRKGDPAAGTGIRTILSGEDEAYRRTSHMIPIRTSTPAITTTRIVWNRFIHLFCMAAPRPDYKPVIFRTGYPPAANTQLR